METTDRPLATSGQWCLVTVRQWKRDAFLRYLENDIENKKLQEIFLEVVEPEDAVYENMLLIRISNYSEARSHLKQVENFQNMQRLKPDEANRMLNK
ncbi:MAG: chromosome segregation ATPase [Cyanobacteria bacterium P01_G01_bin.19]